MSGADDDGPQEEPSARPADKGGSAPAPLPRAWAAAPAALSLLLFARTVGFEFVNWDDPMYITGSRRILDDSLSGLLHLWDPTAPYAPGGFVEYHPLRDTLYWVLHAVFGAVAWPFHLVNVLLHAAVCAAVGPVLVRLGVPRAGALVGALVFAAHPVHVESVAWVSSTKDPLYTLFALAILWMWPRAERAKQIAKAIALLVGGLLVKAMIIVVPVQVFLYDLVIKRRSLRTSTLRALPLAVVAGLATLNFLALGRVHAHIVPLKGGSWLSNTLTALWSLTSYVSTLVLPLDLNPRYVVPPVTEVLSPQGIAGSVVGLVFAITILGLARARPQVSFGFALYLTGLLSVLGFIPTGIEVADHFQYFASVGYSYLLGWAFVGLSAQRGQRLAMGLTALLVMSLSIGTLRLTGVWRNSVTMWERVVDQPQADALPRMRYNYGLALMEAGRTDEGVEQLQRLAAAPAPPEQTLPARAVLAKLALNAGRVDEARHLLGRPAPESVDARFTDDYALLALHEGDLPRATTFAALGSGRKTPSWHALILAAIADAEGEPARADEHLARSAAANAGRCAPGGLAPLPASLQASLAPRLRQLCAGIQSSLPTR